MGTFTARAAPAAFFFEGFFGFDLFVVIGVERR